MLPHQERCPVHIVHAGLISVSRFLDGARHPLYTASLPPRARHEQPHQCGIKPENFMFCSRLKRAKLRAAAAQLKQLGPRVATFCAQ